MEIATTPTAFLRGVVEAALGDSEKNFETDDPNYPLALELIASSGRRYIAANFSSHVIEKLSPIMNLTPQSVGLRVSSMDLLVKTIMTVCREKLESLRSAESDVGSVGFFPINLPPPPPVDTPAIAKRKAIIRENPDVFRSLGLKEGELLSFSGVFLGDCVRYKDHLKAFASDARVDLRHLKATPLKEANMQLFLRNPDLVKVFLSKGIYLPEALDLNFDFTITVFQHFRAFVAFIGRHPTLPINKLQWFSSDKLQLILEKPDLFSPFSNVAFKALEELTCEEFSALLGNPFTSKTQTWIQGHLFVKHK